jgi:hypothetical protein
MPFLHMNRGERLAELVDRLRESENATADLVSAVVTIACERISLSDRTPRSARFKKFVEAGAWADAALALIESELPLWKLRRLAYDEGQWYCALSRQRELPEWLDQAVEASHTNPTLAILSVYVETLRQIEASREPSRPSVPQMRVVQYERLCCDNFT